MIKLSKKPSCVGFLDSFFIIQTNQGKIGKTKASKWKKRRKTDSLF